MAAPNFYPPIPMILLIANAYGQRKAERFRKHFGFEPPVNLGASAREYMDVHDYLHTHLGALPEWGGDEERVVDFEDQIRAGKVNPPRGLKLIRV